MSTTLLRTAAAGALWAAVSAFHATPVAAQLQSFDIAIPEGASAEIVRGHSVGGPRCFEFTPGDRRAGIIEIVAGNGTLMIEGVAADVERHDFDAGPWTYYITVTPEPIGGAGGPFEIQLSWR